MQVVAVREVAGLMGAGAPLSVCQGVGYMDGWRTAPTTVSQCVFLLVS